MRLFTLITLLLLSIGILFADSILLLDDPIYPFLEQLSAQRIIPQPTNIYPYSKEDIITVLRSIDINKLSPSYRAVLQANLNRLTPYQQDPRFVFASLDTVKKTIPQVFKSHNRPIHFYQYADSSRYFLFSGRLQTQIDSRHKDGITNSRYFSLMGAHFGGNLNSNLGFVTDFWMGQYNGDKEFLFDHSYLTGWYQTNDGISYSADNLTAEATFTNPVLNLASGYGNFQIGKTITSSLILNETNTPYGYLKYYKNFGNWSYGGVIAQLLPDSLAHGIASLQYDDLKSYALHTLVYHKEYFELGLGTMVIYGDRSLDLAYAVPFSFDKIIEHNQHDKDNVALFGFNQCNLPKGYSIWCNYFIDDLYKSKLPTSWGVNRIAGQLGIEKSLSSFPISIDFETTAIRPWVYAHKNPVNRAYTHDSECLGYPDGANLLSFATQLKGNFSKGEWLIKYVNRQQGSEGADPFIPNNLPGYSLNHKIHFLAGNNSRKETIQTKVNYRIRPEIKLFLEFLYENNNHQIGRYLFSGISTEL